MAANRMPVEPRPKQARVVHPHRTGGAMPIGGMMATGGLASMGGVMATGGMMSMGGMMPTGGSKATGGMLATGGSKATGGMLATGGSKATGGMLATGGMMPTGGMMATGGSKATGGSSSTGAPTFTTIYTTIISTRCVVCHAPGGGGVTSGALDMSTQATAYANLVGVAAAGSACGGFGTRVVAGNASISILWEKVNAKTQGTTAVCGSGMPLTGAALTQAQVDEIAAWINAGAMND